MNIDEVKDFLENNEEGKELLVSLTDKRVSTAIETYKKNHYSKELDEMQQTIERLQTEKKNSALRDIARNAGLPDELLDYAIGNDEKETEQKAADLLSKINGTADQRAEADIKERLKGRDPFRQDFGDSMKSINDMTSDEIIANAANFK